MISFVGGPRPESIAKWESAPECNATTTVTVYNFTGQRADKVRVERVRAESEVSEDDSVSRSGIVKKIEYYTMECPECGGTGRYDDIGEVVCESCGLVLSDSGDPPMLPVDYSNSRGFSEMEGIPVPGHTQPS